MANNVVILGAGPAGLSCALWLHNSGYRPVVLERAPHGGGMLRFNHHRNDWLLGFPDATGLSIKERFLEHARRRDFPIMISTSITRFEQNSRGFAVACVVSGQPQEIETDFLVIATGTRPRAPVELAALALRFPDKWFIGAGELHVDDFSAGQRVAILGGGDNALENACLLAQQGIVVDVYFRGTPRARREWQAHCATLPGITLHSGTATSQFAVQEEGVTFLADGERRRADVVVVMYGYEPNTDTLVSLAPWLAPAIDGEGFVKVDIRQRTRVARVYAVGDVTDRPLPCLPSAIGQGSVAAKAIIMESEGLFPAS